MVESLITKALAAHKAGDLPQAVTLYQQVLAAAPKNDVAWHNFGVVLSDGGNLKGAAQAFANAGSLNEKRTESWMALARTLLKLGDIGSLPPVLEKLDRLNAGPEVLVFHSQLAALEGDNDKAAALAIDAGRKAGNKDIWLDLALLFLEWKYYKLALAVLDEAVKALPDAIQLEWLRAFTCALPVYETQEEVAEYHRLYKERTAALLKHLQSLPPEKLKGLDKMIDVSYGLFLGYNGENVREAQSTTGEIFHLVMQANYNIPPLAPMKRDKPVIAIVSETFYYHSNMKLRRSWLRRIDRNKFRLVLYHVGEKTDHYTDQIRAMADEFHHIPRDFDALVKQLLKDKPDVIQFTNIGLSTLTLKLAALRLAPVQAMTWGHPITSGLPTMDYYLSNEAMEPDDAPLHHRENLRIFPGLSLVPEAIFAEMPPNSFTRADFGIREDDVFYLSVQSQQKYLPRYDYLYAHIAKEVPQARFVFIRDAKPAIDMIFRRRIWRSFIDAGLDPARHVIFLPAQDQPHYRALHMLADITLDSMGWSGANTSFEALELGGLPITHPGEFMRGRHTAGILQFMGVPELVANTEEDYIRMAIELGNDAAKRKEKRAALQAALPNLYRDPGIAEALNGFYAEALRNVGLFSAGL